MRFWDPRRKFSRILDSGSDRGTASPVRSPGRALSKWLSRWMMRHLVGAVLWVCAGPVLASDFEPDFPDGIGDPLFGTPAAAEKSASTGLFSSQVDPQTVFRAQSEVDEELLLDAPSHPPVEWRNEIDQPSRIDALNRRGQHRGGLLDFLLRDRPWIVDGPVVPEPMVFDMVRPMHARKGELEANVLGVVPLHRRRTEVDWAPEIEYAIADGFGIEFEFPFLDDNLEALKFAVQYTFDVGLDNRLIHGYHGIYEYIFDGELSEMTSLYLVGMRFNEVWSVMGMFGFRSTVEGAAGTHFTELIQNVGFFADVNDRLILGVETNMAHHLSGPSSLLIIPQAHWMLTDNLNLQFGFGLQANADEAVAVHAFRVVWER
jgi:hypothetical protein